MNALNIRRINKLKTEKCAKIAENKKIADSMYVQDGVVVISTAQKTVFQKNMSDIRKIIALIEVLERED